MGECKYIVYCLTNKINGKKYIGITHRTLKERIAQHIKESRSPCYPTYNTPLKRAIRKYGIENFQEEILEENLTAAEASEKEKFYIKMFQTYYKYANNNGYNATLGGELVRNGPKDRVVQLNPCTGQKIGVYESRTAAELIFGRGIAECINHQEGKQTAGGYCWLFEKEYLKMSAEELFDYVNILTKKVVQLDKDGKIVNFFNSPTDASRKLNIEQTNISSVLLKKRHSAGGYHFMYYEDYLKNGFSIAPKRQGNHKPIHQLDNNGNIIQTFNSAAEAARHCNTSLMNISSAANHKYKTAGYYWKYV